MSKKPATSAFATKSMFDVLSVDEPEEEEEEEEVQEEEQKEPVEPIAPASLSKAARKKLAKAQSQAAEAAAPTVEVVSKLPEAVIEKLPPVDEVVEKVTEKINGTASEIRANGPTVSEKKVNGFKDALSNGQHIAEESVAKVEEVAQKTVEVATERARATAVQVTSIVNATLESLPKVTPPTSAFKPTLPESLPEPKGNSLPANRKRKTPVDFTPSGPAPSSPKTGVKFEDGVVPGEGKEGEKVIAAVVKKDRNMIERTVWTFIMIFGFIALLCLGHPYMILLVMLCQALVYKEVTALFELRDQGAPKPDSEDGWSKTLNWYFFVVTNYFLYGESIIYYFKHIVFVDAYFIPFAKNHRFISFMLYVVGFVGFVANLQKQYLRQQFALFCWVHMSLLVIVFSSHFIINNILEGLIWFFVPASLVICNDVMAYICGKAFGKTPLIKLSPKKTVEGFVGAFICTLIFGLAWGTFFMRFNYMICPARDLGTNVLSQVTCKPNPVFIWRSFHFTGLAKTVLQAVLGHPPPAISYAPFQLHTLVMATFASLVAPFGGFFASGFKRAFNIKDFGHSIPGHGGMTDRMDCQFMMGMFAYVYYSSLIRIQNVTVGGVLQTVVTSFTTEQQLELLADLKRFLEGQGVRIKA